jgi:site-specific DNA-methyltransferase (adenine-specific)/site-specific DNA-methyltransferase (cytosine-N4-specific)
MYYYPDNIYEEIVVFKKPGEFDRSSIPGDAKEKSRINTSRFHQEKWYLSVWDIKNVLPTEKWSKYTAAFPEEIPERLITLYSYVGETVLDPFLGTGTTCVVAKRLYRNCIGYELDLELREAIEERLSLKQATLTGEKAQVEYIVREDAKHLRTKLREEVEKRINSREK